MVQTELPAVVDATWLQAHLDDPDLVVGDVRGPNAHMRRHIPGSRPLVLGSPMPTTDPTVLAEFAREVQLRLRRHGITGEERLVLYDRGDGVGALPAAQLAELAGHTRVAILLGGLASWPGAVEEGTVELEPVRETTLEVRLGAMPTYEELSRRLSDSALTILDVRRPEEYSGKGGAPCDPRQGHIPGARHLQVDELFVAVGEPESPERIRELVGLDEGAEIVAYCHSGSRSAVATLALRSAGYEARNYTGSWHEWSRHDELPIER
jgi:thiosulfate/3-mercaptopyruvate sulfurtransferase